MRRGSANSAGSANTSGMMTRELRVTPLNTMARRLGTFNPAIRPARAPMGTMTAANST